MTIKLTQILLSITTLISLGISSVVFPHKKKDAEYSNIKIQFTSFLKKTNNIPSLTIKQLRSGLADSAHIVFITDIYKSGLFELTNDSKSTDDSSMIIVSAGRRFKRIYDGDIKPEWFGAIPNDSLDDTAGFIKVKNWSSDIIKIPAGTFLLNNLDLGAKSLVGAGNGSTILKATGKSCVLRLGYDTPHWRRKFLQDFTIDGNYKTAHGIKFQASSQPEISGRWIIDRVNFDNCDYAIYKPDGNIGNVFRDCLFQKNNFGYYAIGSKLPFMHAGFDSFYNCSFIYNFQSAIYINSNTPGTGGTVLDNCHMEGNEGFGIFVKNYATGWTPLSINGLWTEKNAFSRRIEINKISYIPSTIYLENTENFSINNSALSDGIVIKNSKGSVRSSYIYGSGLQSVDSLSTVYGEELVTDIYRGGIIVNSLRDVKRPLSGIADVLRAPARKNKSKNFNPLLSESFSDGAVTLSGDKEKQVGTVLEGGVSFDNFNRFIIPSNRTQISGPIQIKKGKFYVLSISIRQISDEKPKIHFSYSVTASNNLQSQLIKNKWVTLATVGEADTSGIIRLYLSTNKMAKCILDLQALQIVEFESRQEAISFYNEGYLAIRTKM